MIQNLLRVLQVFSENLHIIWSFELLAWNNGQLPSLQGSFCFVPVWNRQDEAQSAKGDDIYTLVRDFAHSVSSTLLVLAHPDIWTVSLVD